jgi:hypothetical protein
MLYYIVDVNKQDDQEMCEQDNKEDAPRGV